MNVDTTEQPDDLEGELSTVTDEEWRAAHEALALDVLDQVETRDQTRVSEQFGYTWAPGEDSHGDQE